MLLSEFEIGLQAVDSALPDSDQARETPSGTLAERITSFERTVITVELQRHQCRMTEVARVLGLERSHLYKKCHILGIDLQAIRQRRG